MKNQGQNADDNAKFRSGRYFITKRELALRKEDATGKSAQEEIAKEERESQRKRGWNVNKIDLGITDLGKDLKQKNQMLVKVFSKAHFKLVCF